MTGDYYSFEVSADALRFEFDSIGPRGVIRKAVSYSPLPVTTGLYNLGFGNLREDGKIDDKTVSNNGDMEKVLATVVQTLPQFFRVRPNKGIFFAGSTASRTRLYQIAITRSLEEVSDRFTVLGIRNGMSELFVVGEKYEGFILFSL